MRTVPDGVEVVANRDEAERASLPPLLIVDRLTDFLDSRGLGTGSLEWERVGKGQSNITYRLARGDTTLVLRRGPRPPLPPSTHDMMREARIQQLLHARGVPVPEILAVCADGDVLGVPFYVMEWLDGRVITDSVPAALDNECQRHATSLALVEALAQLHAVDITRGPLASFGKAQGYLERQIRRFAGLWEVNSSRHLPEVARLATWLTDNLPQTAAVSVVHGDFRLGNLMLRRDPPAATMAILDWEMAALGDPLADLGYLTATYTDRTSLPTPLHLSPVTARIGYLSSAELASEYAERTGADLRALPWYEILALWKAAVFCEAIYTRWIKGERPNDQTFAPSLEVGVPTLLAAAGAARERA
jgi:aminoglycoside phosphotransferase (APT) family kinase protein